MAKKMKVKFTYSEFELEEPDELEPFIARVTEDVRKRAPNNTGQYPRSIIYSKKYKIKDRKSYKRVDSMKYAIYASGKRAAIGWLLENGHLSKKGEIVEAQPHFRTAQIESSDEYVELMRRVKIKRTKGKERPKI